jgi:PHD/YefM family antitoxin component YafN of YafNO toxin-antitoxin module
MSIMSISEVRENLAEAINASAVEAVFIERHGKAAAVLISPERYELLMDALEDIEDLSSIEEHRANPQPGIPWEKVKSDLGLE